MRKGSNQFTVAIHDRGWSVWDACEFWGIRYETFYDRVNNDRMKAQLLSMCLGLEIKGVEVD